MTNRQPFPYRDLQTDRLLLRKMTEADLPALLTLRSNPDLMRYIPRTRAQSLEDVRDMYEKVQVTVNSGDGIHWGVYFRDSDLLIGTIGFYRCEPENFRGEVGYMLHPDHQGKGIMQEALAAAVEYGQEVLQFHTITAWIHPDNHASINLVSRNGFVKEAHFKDNVFFEGEYQDTLVYTKIGRGIGRG